MRIDAKFETHKVNQTILELGFCPHALPHLVSTTGPIPTTLQQSQPKLEALHLVTQGNH